MVVDAQQQGISMRQSCKMLIIQRRRVLRWGEHQRDGQGLANCRPGPEQAPHRVLSGEREQVLALARREDYADCSHRILTVLGWEQKIVWVSFSTTYRILKQAGLMTGRCHYHRHNGHSLPPTRRALTGPNQRWCWDISYLLTYERGIFLYLYLLLDEYSRKALAWRISWQQTLQEARELLDDGMRAENILDLPEDQRPEVFNDRGRQMKAKPIQRMLEDMKMPQRFARPRTPNDNPFIEASFSTIKRDPDYPGRFRDPEDGYGYFNPYLTWYNQEHYHSGINYVPPDQAHRGFMDRIVAQRQEQRLAQCRRRREVNLNEIAVLR